MNTMLSVNALRVLSADMVQKANSGHPGMPIGAAPIAYAIFREMKVDPKRPQLMGRDRFVLSSGHASALLYSMLHLMGYGLTAEDLASFRQWDSKTPGHPEYGVTTGVDASTGPLGQGFCMAVGMAMAQEHLAARFNKPGFPVFDNYTYTLMGDGCMMEGATSEAASLAGTQKLKKLIAIYDSNRITIEGSTDIAFTEDVMARYKSYGWNVLYVANGEDVDAIIAAINEAKGSDRPTLITVRTNIAQGTAKEGKASAHGEPLGQENIDAFKKSIGWSCADFQVPDEVKADFAAIAEKGKAFADGYEAMLAGYAKQYPEMKAELDGYMSKALPDELLNDESLFTWEGAKATRAVSGELLNKIYKYMPGMFGGSADLGPSNKTEIKGQPFFSPDDRTGCNIHFGVRELAMACVCNGVALYGGLRAYCATFLVFADYVKPALRLSALMELPVMYVLTHDSIGVGEDGPTHQPIEQLSSLRATPNTYVFRPADGKEAAAAYIEALQLKGPSVMALTRQNLPTYEETGRSAMRGGYVLRDPKGGADVILMASGSEVELIYKAADILAVQGYTARLVSMPCMELFDMQDKAYKESVLPNSMRARVAVEAGATMSWYKYTGIDGKVVGIDHFGASAPAKICFKEFGFTAENVAAAALEAIKSK